MKLGTLRFSTPTYMSFTQRHIETNKQNFSMKALLMTALPHNLILLTTHPLLLAEMKVQDHLCGMAYTQRGSGPSPIGIGKKLENVCEGRF